MLVKERKLGAISQKERAVMGTENTAYLNEEVVNIIEPAKYHGNPVDKKELW